MAGETLIGVTTDSYAGLQWDCDGFMEKTVVLVNTHDTNSLKYRVLARAQTDGVDAEEIAETTLGPLDSVRIGLNNWLARIKVECKADTPGSQATWQIDYGGRLAGGAGGGFGLHLIKLP